MSSGSSEDENVELLLEAADAEFINDAMFSDSSKDEKPIDVAEKQPSLRPVREDDQFNLLNVTPEFQAYVARQLGKLLDRRLEKSTVAHEYVQGNRRKKRGVRLFSDSKNFLRVNKDEIFKKGKFEIKRRTIDDEPIDEDVKAEMAAVSGESVLNKKDVAHWSGRSKAEIFNYRKDRNGQLVHVEKSA